MPENNFDIDIIDSPFRQRLSHRIPEVDGLRGIAILSVLAFHFFGEGINYGQNPWLVDYLAAASKFGANGVILFFVLSGFLIGGILIDHRDSANYFKTFYVRRIFRIFPLYYSLIVIFYLLSMLGARCEIMVPAWVLELTFSINWYLTFTQNFPMFKSGNMGDNVLAPTWSLAVEEQFYLTLSLIIRFVPRKLLSGVVTALIGSAVIFRIVMWYQTSNLLATKVLMPSCLDSLMMGVLIAVLLRSLIFARLIERYRLRLIIPAGLFLVIVLHFVDILFIKIFTRLAENPGIINILSLNLLFGLLLIAAVTAKSNQIISKILCNRILRKFGELSYFIYLFHMVIALFVNWQIWGAGQPPFGLIWFLELSLILLITLVLAQLSWKYFEKPLIDYGHRWKY